MLARLWLELELHGLRAAGAGRGEGDQAVDELAALERDGRRAEDVGAGRDLHAPLVAPAARVSRPHPHRARLGVDRADPGDPLAGIGQPRPRDGALDRGVGCGGRRGQCDE